VAIFNPYGSQHIEKGFTEDQIHELLEILKTLIKKGYYVLFLDESKNRDREVHPKWILDQIKHSDPQLLPYVGWAPSPRYEPLLLKYCVAKCDLVVSVEGGFAHHQQQMAGCCPRPHCSAPRKTSSRHSSLASARGTSSPHRASTLNFL